MTNVRRPIHLGLRPSSVSSSSSLAPTCSPKPLSPSADSLPSQIVPHLYVGNLEQTNRDTLNRLNISYILSLGLLPLISTRSSPSSPTPGSAMACTGSVVLPGHNSSMDFKIRLRANGPLPSNRSAAPQADSTTATTDTFKRAPLQQYTSLSIDRDENTGVRQTRNVHCKCINIFDNNEQTLIKFFDEAHQFIDEARRKKCNILIHCLAGISRSPAVAIAYLMKVNSLRLQDAYNLVKQCRPQIDPSLGFMGQLMMYEKILEEHRLDHQKHQQLNTSNANQTKKTFIENKILS